MAIVYGYITLLKLYISSSYQEFSSITSQPLGYDQVWNFLLTILVTADPISETSNLDVII